MTEAQIQLSLVAPSGLAINLSVEPDLFGTILKITAEGEVISLRLLEGIQWLHERGLAVYPQWTRETWLLVDFTNNPGRVAGVAG